MKRDNRIFLNHILEAIINIEDYVKNLTSSDDLIKDKKTRDAVLRSFQVIGEATNNLDENFLVSNTEIEWEKVIGMRNFIIHEYFGVDLEIVWDTIKDDLPMFKENIKKLLQKILSTL
ncbi:hypothetical protein AUK04_01350 [Candidatus Roizmanbacteria bacterium CG2_30_33_16]|uniref:DUF86 domain-containing protein n=3 Tax=Candidatus Roizmaniibacteriota TaxID=1752723 RepID=A0A2H0C448_9BACT|nr:MAG: hypothetical protein AUK04_01350 [Candidatus Roizmanbacteria bacterium CG2_30_33_16]PIP64682.1 MAG: hypothetical protein COW96_01155 [Candidatus Roizmanbacteria bacterium CG22_combo_CG10-13_8_21_14_all_33_16]